MKTISILLIALSVARIASSNEAQRRHLQKTSYQEAKIVGGSAASLGEYPYMASLQSSTRHECGGVLVAPDFLLTAAHCCDGTAVRAVVNRRVLFDDSEMNSVTVNITSCTIHPTYFEFTDQFDVGLVELAEPVTTIAPIEMSNDASILLDGMDLTVMGYGDLGNGVYPGILQEVVVQYMSNEACKEYEDPLGLGVTYRYFIYDDMMCALGDNKDACFGDSGGPLITKSGGVDTLVGITSWGIGCARLPGVYARVHYMYEWLADTICVLSANPPSYLNCARTSGFGGGTNSSTIPATTPSVAPSMSMAPTNPTASSAPSSTPTTASPSKAPTTASPVTATPPPTHSMPTMVNGPPPVASRGDFDADDETPVVEQDASSWSGRADDTSSWSGRADDTSSGHAHARGWIAVVLLGGIMMMLVT